MNFFLNKNYSQEGQLRQLRGMGIIGKLPMINALYKEDWRAEVLKLSHNMKQLRMPELDLGKMEIGSIVGDLEAGERRFLIQMSKQMCKDIQKIKKG